MFSDENRIIALQSPWDRCERSELGKTHSRRYSKISAQEFLNRKGGWCYEGIRFGIQDYW
ncbi:MAG: hypothetical protein ACREV6_06765 [Clostridium sp.]|uniref:hypothetical protein n=1 Tax=Clostridium sp. TaxID=1506 RepID=UPI003D6CE553